jgi:hypothetical protein
VVRDRSRFTELEPEMEYLLIVNLDGAAIEALPEDEKRELDARSIGHDRELEARGRLVAARALQSPATAVTVRVRDGRISTTDGPFAETREQIGGFLLIEARDLNEAIDIAAQIPVGQFGCIEVRPIYKIPGSE